MSFDTLGLHADLLRAVQDLRFTEPTPIQRDAIPAGLAGKDVLACSATGSGKTAAFLLPILQKLLQQPKHGVTRVLVLTPTRELAQQIDENLESLAKHTMIRGASIVGGLGMGPQRHALEKGIEIIVATPGRLLDHLQYPYAKLGHVEMLVLDEADRMLDMGFLPDIKRIVGHLPAKRQTFFFSATLPPEIVSLTRQWLHDPVRINIERQAKPAAGITQTLYPVPHLLKQSLLVKLLKDTNMDSVLVFTRTKRRADRVADHLKRSNISATRIHGDRTQGQRNQALEGFKSGRYKVLVATDVAARGIDINALSHVINFDLPGSSEDYIHRIGRTARAQATGDALTFVAPEDEGELKAIERAVGASIPRVMVEGFDYKNIPQVPHGQHGHRGQRQHQRHENRGEGGGHRQHRRDDRGQRHGGQGGQGGNGRGDYRPHNRDGGHGEQRQHGGGGNFRKRWQRDDRRGPKAYGQKHGQQNGGQRFQVDIDDDAGNRIEAAPVEVNDVNGNVGIYGQAPQQQRPVQSGQYRGPRQNGQQRSPGGHRPWERSHSRSRAPQHSERGPRQ